MGRRARPRCRTSGTRSSPSGSAGLRGSLRGYALVGLENVALWHERDISHSSAERVVLPDAFLAVDYMLDRFAWLVEGLVVRPERMRANLEATGGLFFSQRLLLALVDSGLDRDTAYRAVQRHAMRAWDEGLDFRTLVRGDPEHRRTRGSRRGLRPRLRTPVTPMSSSSDCRLRGERRSMPEAVHVASGKVREIFALDDERLLLVASDRISTFDVILPTPIPDKGRVLTGLSAFWFSRTTHIVPNHLLELRDDARSMVCRKLEMLPIECVVRGYLTGSGWRDYTETGAVCGHVLPDGPARFRPAAGADLHAGDEGERGARREHRRGAGGRAVRPGPVPRCKGGVARAVRASRPSTPRSAESSSLTRSSSSGWQRTARSRWATRR